MLLISKVLKIAHMSADKLMEKDIKKPHQINTQEFDSLYKNSNERIQKLRDSIQNTKL